MMSQPPHGVDVWLFDLDQPLSSPQSFLSPQEVDRAKRFATSALRARWIASRHWLRCMLGRYLGISPSEVRLEVDSLGKPWIANGPSHAPRLHFSLSHSAGYGAMALSRESLVGVDLELADRPLNVEAIASVAFSSDEQTQWERLPKDQQRTALLESWTSKEAFLKCLGVGIATGLQQTSLPSPPLPRTFSPKSIDRALFLQLSERTRLHLCGSSLLPGDWTIGILSLPIEGTLSVACRAGVHVNLIAWATA